MAFFPRTMRALFHPLDGREPEFAFFDDLKNGWSNPAPPLFGGSSNTTSKGDRASGNLSYKQSDFGSFQ